jgi:Excalibur calcium-binding domain
MRIRATAVAVVLGLGASLFAGSPADAATRYANCTALHKAYKYGVAKSAYAATHARPASIRAPKVSSSLYSANSAMDRDKDGVACEVSR